MWVKEQDGFSEQVLEAYQRFGAAKAAEILRSSPDPLRQDAIRSTLQKMAKEEDDRLDLQQRSLENKREWRNWITSAVAFLALVAMAISAIGLSRELRRRQERWQRSEQERTVLAHHVSLQYAELQNAMNLLTEAQSIAKLGHWSLDLAAGHGSWSAQMFALTGRVVDDGVPSLSWFLDRVHPDDRKNLEAHQHAAVTHGQPFTLRFRFSHPEAGWRWMQTRARPVVDSEQNTVRSLTGTLQDVDDLAQIETRLREMNTALEARVEERTRELANKNRQLEAFTYSVSHDLKAPLRGIDGYGRLLEIEKSHLLDEEGLEFVATIRSATRQMGRLIDDLLAYARLDQRIAQRQKLNLAELVEDVVAVLRQDPDLSHVQWNCRLTPLPLETDREAVNMILRNLLDNAVKFSRHQTPPMITIDLTADDRDVTLRVQDNGIGFDCAYKDRIFEIFQRLNPAERYSGTGVGLALVRRSAELLGGSCSAEGNPGNGAIFTVRIPR